MLPTETAGNPLDTASETDVMATLARIENHLALLQLKADHLDEQIHGIAQVIEDHKPLLARAAALADPGAKVRAMLHPRTAKKGTADHG